MPGPVATIGTIVMLSPGAAGPPDTGAITAVLPPLMTANGMPMATSGSICTMVNSVTGIPYPLPIGQPASSGVSVAGKSLVRLGDVIPTPPGILTIMGPLAITTVIDNWP